MIHTFNSIVISTIPSCYCKKVISTSPQFTRHFVIEKICQLAYTHITQALPNLNGIPSGPITFPIFISFNAIFTLVIMILQKKSTASVLCRATRIASIIYTISIKMFIKINFPSLFNFLLFYGYTLTFIFNAPDTIQVSFFNFSCFRKFISMITSLLCTQFVI